MKLKTYLEMLNMSGATFAEKIKVSPSMVSLLIKGDRKPSLALLLKIMMATEGKVTATDFMEG